MAKNPSYPLISIVSGVTVEGNNAPHVGITAKTDDLTAITIWVPATDLADLRDCAKQFVASGLSGSYDFPFLIGRLREAVKKVTAETRYIAKFSGWHDNEYAFNGRIYGVAKDTKWQWHKPQSGYDYPKKQDNRLFSFVEANAVNSDFLAMSLMVAFVSPLLAQLTTNERPLIHIWGESRTGKTTILKTINALCHPPGDDSRALLPFNFTSRGMEEILHQANGNLACFDEVGTVGATELEKILETLLYIAGNGRGKLRSQSSGLSESFPNLTWSTLPIVTGEQDLRGLNSRKTGTGQDARLMALAVPNSSEGGIWNLATPLDPGRHLKLVATLDEVLETYNGDEFQRWIMYIVRHREKVLERFNRKVITYRDEFAGPASSTLRRDVATKFAWFAACGDILRKAKFVRWPKAFPAEVIGRMFAADILAKSNAPSATYPDAVNMARTILARIATDLISVWPKERSSDAIPPVAYIESSGKWVIIDKVVIPKLVGVSEDTVASALRSIPNLLAVRSNSPYYQSRVGEMSRPVLKINLQVLKDCAFPMG